MRPDCPHDIINAHSADYGFSLENVLPCTKNLCYQHTACDCGDMRIAEISEKEPCRRGMGNQAAADLNGDGWTTRVT